MSIDFDALNTSPRILIEAHLKPVAGTRIQPTGFPDLGAALYDDPNGVPTLLVESAQSMANRLEAVCWDEAADDVVPVLKGLPYIRVKLAGLGNGEDTTSSLLEFHRLNSPYILQKPNDPVRTTTTAGRWFREVLMEDLGIGTSLEEVSKKTSTDDGEHDPEADTVAGVINLRKLAALCLKYDPNSLVHGVFLEKLAGRLRHPRALSAFIEASGVRRVDNGGVKLDRAMPDKKTAARVLGIGPEKVTAVGYANVPFHRTEFTAKSIIAFFSIDLGQIRGYGLGDDATNFLIALSLWKTRRFLDSSMRLRTACELELVEGDASIVIKRPDSFLLPTADELASDIKELLGKCKRQFADPTVTELTWNN